MSAIPDLSARAAQPTGAYCATCGDEIVSTYGCPKCQHAKAATNPIPAPGAMAATSRVLSAVFAERGRQDRLVAEGKLPFNCANPDIPDGGKLMVLGEEFGEVARAAYETYTGNDDSAQTAAGKRAHLREELVQLAAVAVAWVEAIDNE